jgi:hypothetical protein
VILATGEVARRILEPDRNKGHLAVKILKIAAAAGFLAASLTSAAWAQDASGAMSPTMAPNGSMNESSQSAMTPGASSMPPSSMPPSSMPMAPSAETSASDTNAIATVNQVTVTNGPVPDTAANRAKYGAPMSHAGKVSKPAGN